MVFLLNFLSYHRLNTPLIGLEVFGISLSVFLGFMVHDGHVEIRWVMEFRAFEVKVVGEVADCIFG